MILFIMKNIDFILFFISIQNKIENSFKILIVEKFEHGSLFRTMNQKAVHRTFSFLNIDNEKK